MIRASLYVLAAGLVWFAEGFLFSRFFDFNPWQTVLAAAFYLAVFVLVIRYLLRSRSRIDRPDDQVAMWRMLSVAPMLVVILGSFISLPVMLLILALGKAG